MTPFIYNAFIRFYDVKTLFPPELIQILGARDPTPFQLLTTPPAIPRERWLAYEVLVLTAHWPLILGSVILLVLFWRALLRTRELYADARVVQWQGDDPQPL